MKAAISIAAAMTWGSEPQAEGQFFDGHSAQPLPVLIAARKDGVWLKTSDGKVLRWPFTSINWSVSPIDSIPLRFVSLAEDDASLVVNDPDKVEKIRQHYQRWAKHNHSYVNAELLTILRATLGTFAVLLGLWFGWPLAADALAPHVPVSWHDRLGEIAYESFVKPDSVCHTEAGDQALNIIRDRLVGKNPALAQVSVTVVKLPITNAMTFANQNVVVTSRLIKEAQSGDEIAGVLAHEFGHAENDHVMRGILRNGLLEILMSSLGSNVGSLSHAADMMVDMAYSRKFEAEADRAGLNLLQAANISPKGFRDFFEREKNRKKTEHALKYVMSHPPSADRAAMIAEAPMPKHPTEVLTTEQFEALKVICGSEKVSSPAPVKTRKP